MGSVLNCVILKGISVFLILGVLITPSCTVDKIIIPDHSTPVIKIHNRIMVVAAQPPWTPAGISVEPGDYVLVLASGKADIGRGLRGAGPHGWHFGMKIGDGSAYANAVDRNSRNLFQATDTGRIQFGVIMSMHRGVDQTQASWYHNNKGGYLIDVFVFSVGSIQAIKQALSEVAQANPEDAILNQQIRQITEFEVPETILTQAQLSLDTFEKQTERILNSNHQPVKVKNGNNSTEIRQNPRPHVDGGHLEAITCMALSSDGKHVITGGRDNQLKLWEKATGREIRSFKGHSDAITSVAFSPDDRQIVSGSLDRTLRVWDIRSDAGVQIYTGSESGVTAVAFHPDGTWILSADKHDFIRVWEAHTGKLHKKLLRYGAGFSSIAVSPDGRTIISGSVDGSVCLWDLNHRKPVHVFQGADTSVDAVLISRDGHLAASGGRDRAVRVWDLREKKLRHVLKGHENAVTTLTLGPNGNELISTAWDNTCIIWDMSAGKLIDTLDLRGKSAPVIAISPDGKQLAAGMEDRTIRLYDLKKKRLLKTFINSKRHVVAAKFSTDGKHALSATNQFIQLWDLASGRELKLYNRHQATVTALAFSPDGESFVSGGQTGLFAGGICIPVSCCVNIKAIDPG